MRLEHHRCRHQRSYGLSSRGGVRSKTCLLNVCLLLCAVVECSCYGLAPHRSAHGSHFHPSEGPLIYYLSPRRVLAHGQHNTGILDCAGSQKNSPAFCSCCPRTCCFCACFRRRLRHTSPRHLWRWVRRRRARRSDWGWSFRHGSFSLNHAQQTLNLAFRAGGCGCRRLFRCRRRCHRCCRRCPSSSIWQ